MDLHVIRSSKSENHIFRIWTRVYYQHNSETNYSKNITFGILHMYHTQMLLETFYKDRIKTVCTEPHKKILIH